MEGGKGWEFLFQQFGDIGHSDTMLEPRELEKGSQGAPTRPIEPAGPPGPPRVLAVAHGPRKCCREHFRRRNGAQRPPGGPKRTLLWSAAKKQGPSAPFVARDVPMADRTSDRASDGANDGAFDRAFDQSIDGAIDQSIDGAGCYLIFGMLSEMLCVICNPL